jgi:two-component system, NtrC family, C4-dicarboxylate transport sensor histidine kinase DctB
MMIARGPRAKTLVFVLLGTTIGLLAWLVQGTRELTAEARERFFEQYNRQQLLVAEQAAHTIEGLFATFRRHLTLVAGLFPSGRVNAARAKEVSETLRAVYDVLSDTPVIDLVVFDRDGTVVAILPDEPETLGRNYEWRPYYRWARDRGAPGKMYLSPFLRLEGGQQRGDMALIVAEGIYSRSGRFEGVVILTVNFDELARKHILSIRFGENGYAWLLDSRNRSILVDPRGKVTGQSYENAFMPRWPKLYAFALGAGGGQPGVDWYDFEDPADPSREVRKLVGYAPVRIEDSLWTLGVCTPVGEVEGLLGSFLDRQESFSLGLVAAALAGVGALLGLVLTWNRALSKEVVARTSELTAAQSKLETAFEELLAARKVAAVGQLAVGLAHEIRNPLSSIRMNVQMLRKRAQADASSRENFQIVEQEILRLNRLLSELMSFARPAPFRLERTRLPEVLRRVLQLLEQRLEQAGVEVEVVEPAALRGVLCDPEQLQQVFLNLLLNAVEALEGLATERRIEFRFEEEGDFSTFSIRDTGPGISSEDRGNLFDPFFTTKAQGGGLGLSIVQGIVLRHGGAIDAASDPGGGTTVTVRLPVHGVRKVTGAAG